MDQNVPVNYNHDYEADKLAAISTTAEIEYRKTLARTGNEQLALQAAEAAATNGRDLIQIYGQQGLQALTQAGQFGIGVADLLSKLQGPANAFAYDRAINGVNSSGLSNAIGALTGSYRPPAFQQMGATSPMTLDSMAGQTSGGNSGVIDQLLGVAGNAQGQQSQIESGKLPFSLPQFDANGSGNATGSTPTSSVTNNYHYYGSSPTPTGAAPTAGGAPTTSTPGLTNQSATTGGFSMGTPQYSTDATNYLNALPDPSQVNARGYNALSPYSQQVALSGYAAKGYDPTQLQGQFAAMLPQFKSPSFGMVG